MSSATVFDGIRYFPGMPKPEQPVFVKTLSLAPDDIGIYCRLLEYGNVTGLLLTGEVSSRRVRNPAKLLKLKQQDVCVVLRVDGDHIDLSKRAVEETQRAEIISRYGDLKTFGTMLTSVGMALSRNGTEVTTQMLVEYFLWPLHESNYESTIEAIVAIANDTTGELAQELIFSHHKETPAWRDEAFEQLMQIVRTRYAPKSVVVRAHFHLTCLGPAGIEGIKAAIRAGLRNEENVQIALSQPPEFILTLTDKNDAAGVERAKRIIKEIAKVAKANGGEVKVPHDGFPAVVRKEN